ncbi:hypothetical protein ACIRVF_33510 [Kitasatospora sp. NPDC101157]|uniref:hypothetical protein n=1 Tax=Kitasatospora sp. NPDC101157 TaxID=3364098 RepID=UPI003828A4A0
MSPKVQQLVVLEQVEPFSTSLAVDFALRGDQAGPGHSGEQMDLGAIGATGAPNGPPVHGQ